MAARRGAQAEVAREPVYRRYTLCERKNRAADAVAYNALVQSWPENSRLAEQARSRTPQQGELAFED